MTDRLTILNSKCLPTMRAMDSASVDAIITDPPYGLSNTDPAHVTEAIIRWASGDRDFTPAGKGFMNAEWDAFVPPPAVFDEALRILKPGGHLLCFAGTRTQDLMGLSIRLAGFEIRDSFAWMYGSGMPKGQDIGKLIDKHGARTSDAVSRLKQHLRVLFTQSGRTGAEVDRLCGFRASNYLTLPGADKRFDPWVNIIPSAEKWLTIKSVLGCAAESDDLFNEAEREITQTAKRPADLGGAVKFDQRASSDRERRDIPVTDEAAQWAGWNGSVKPAFEPIIVARKPFTGPLFRNVLEHGTGALNIDATRIAHTSEADRASATPGGRVTSNARLGTEPALGNSERREHERPDTSKGRYPTNVILDEAQAAALDVQTGILSTTGVRSARSREATVEGTSWGVDNHLSREYPGEIGGASRFFYCAKAPKKERPEVNGVQHSTVKPLSLMRYLVKLVTPPGGLILDPFAGSGTTVEAALLEGFRVTAIEREAKYIPLIQQRVSRFEQVGS